MARKPLDKSPEQKKKLLLKALAKHNGIIYKACDAIGISRQLYHIYKNEDPEFKEAARMVIEAQIDKVEEKMLKRIEEGSDKLIEFYMSTKGRKRGYKKTSDIEVKEKKKVIVIKRASESDDS